MHSGHSLIIQHSLQLLFYRLYSFTKSAQSLPEWLVLSKQRQSSYGVMFLVSYLSKPKYCNACFQYCAALVQWRRIIHGPDCNSPSPKLGWLQQSKWTKGTENEWSHTCFLWMEGRDFRETRLPSACNKICNIIFSSVFHHLKLRFIVFSLKWALYIKREWGLLTLNRSCWLLEGTLVLPAEY